MALFLNSPMMDALATIGDISLSPLVSGGILLAMEYMPGNIFGLFQRFIGSITAGVPFSSSESPEAVSLVPDNTITYLRIFFVFCAFRQLNRVANFLATNAWRLSDGHGWDWPEEAAVLTGGSGGIGQKIAERLTAAGIQVAILDLQDLPETLRENKRIHFYKCDITSSESIAATATLVEQDLGHPSILINNAGVAKPQPILETPESTLRLTFNVNSIALWLTTKQFLPHMIKMNKGHVVNMASIASYVALPGGADYSATKAAALSFHEALATEIKNFYKAPNVLTTIVHPAFVDTPLLGRLTKGLKRHGVLMLTPDQIAKPVVAQILSKRGGHLYVPGTGSIAALLRSLPSWTQEMIRDILGSKAVSV